MVKNLFRENRADGRPIFMSWHSLGSPLAIEIANKAGWKASLIDQQHGLFDLKDVISSIMVTKAFGTALMVRVPKLSPSYIGQALDAGAQAILCPMINTVEEALNLVDSVKYPPIGSRSYGPYRAKTIYEGDYFQEANDWTLACAQIETVEAVKNIQDIASTPGLDMIFVGPNDLAISLSHGKEKDIYNQELLSTLDTICSCAKAANKLCGIFANDVDYAKVLCSKGWDIIGVSTDMSILNHGYQENIDRLLQS